MIFSFNLQNFKGSIPKLAVHAVGAKVLEALFLEFPASSTASLKLELYGPHVSLFTDQASKSTSLQSILKTLTTEKQKQNVLTFVRDILNKGITKSFFGFTYFQDLLNDYSQHLVEHDVKEVRSWLLASSIPDHAIHLVSTRSGCRVVATCASYGTPKDRKRLCKSLKGYTQSSLLHKDAYLVILRLLQVTDDTVSTYKLLLQELVTAPKDNTNDEQEQDDSAPSTLLPLALHDNASKLFLLLLCDNDETRRKYLDPLELTILEPEIVTIPDDKGVAQPTSKKEPSVKRKELLAHLQPALLELCTKHATELSKSIAGSRVLKEVYDSLRSEDVVDAMIAACEEALTNENDQDESIFEHVVGHRTIKSLILCDVESNDKKPALFSQAFIKAFDGTQLLKIAESNRGAFVVASLFKVEAVQKQVVGLLKKDKSTIAKRSKQKGTATAGFAALLKEL